MADSQLLSSDELRQLLDYNPETGELKWRGRRPEFFSETGRNATHQANNWNARWADRAALTNLNANGYRRGHVLGRPVLAHRVVWAIQTGEWPRSHIDHLNGVRSDNRWLNLREANHTINGRNTKRHSNNTSGHNGVYWSRIHEKWCANMVVDRRHITIGYFDSAEAAASARKLAEINHGFSKTHGCRE